MRLFSSELVQTQTAIVVRKGKQSPILTMFIDRVVEMVKAPTRGRLRLGHAA